MDKTTPRLFDEVAGLLERETRRLPELERLRAAVASAALFWFDAAPHIAQPHELTAEKMAWMKDEFYLPFPVVAIEDRASLTVIADSLIGDDREVLRGTDHLRHAIEVVPLSVDLCDPRAWREDSEIVAKSMVNRPSRAMLMLFGAVATSSVSAKQFYVHGEALLTLECERGRVVGATRKPDVSRPLSELFLKNVNSSMEWLYTLSDHGAFIMEDAPLSSRRKDCPFPKRKVWREREHLHIDRVDARPIYTILRPREIRRRMRLEDVEAFGAGGHKRPHERRAHVRRLTSERFVHKKGQVVTVKSCWVGPHENVVGNRRYRVILDH